MRNLAATTPFMFSYCEENLLLRIASVAVCALNICFVPLGEYSSHLKIDSITWNYLWIGLSYPLARCAGLKAKPTGSPKARTTVIVIFFNGFQRFTNKTGVSKFVETESFVLWIDEAVMCHIWKENFEKINIHKRLMFCVENWPIFVCIFMSEIKKIFNIYRTIMHSAFKDFSISSTASFQIFKHLKFGLNLELDYCKQAIYKNLYVIHKMQERWLDSSRPMTTMNWWLQCSNTIEWCIQSDNFGKVHFWSWKSRGVGRQQQDTIIHP